MLRGIFFLFCLFAVLYKTSTFVSISCLRLGKVNSIFFLNFLCFWPGFLLLPYSYCFFISLFIVSQIYWMFCGIWFNIFFVQGNHFFLSCSECQRFFFYHLLYYIILKLVLEFHVRVLKNFLFHHFLILCLLYWFYFCFE